MTSTATAIPPRTFLTVLNSFVCCCCCCCWPAGGVPRRWRGRRWWWPESWGIRLSLYLPLRLASMAEAAPSCNLLSWLTGTMVSTAGAWGPPSRLGWSIAMPVEYTERSCRIEGDRPEQVVLHLPMLISYKPSIECYIHSFSFSFSFSLSFPSFPPVSIGLLLHTCLCRVPGQQHKVTLASLHSPQQALVQRTSQEASVAVAGVVAHQQHSWIAAGTASRLLLHSTQEGRKG